MAVYRLSAQAISRSTGRNAVNSAAYRAAEKLHDDRLGKTFSYARKQGVEHAEILAPKNAPAWVTNREKLWNAVEAAEKRKDAQVAREVQVSLPVELTSTRQLALVREFAQDQFVARGMVADVTIHKDDPNNPHAHIMLTTRHLGPDGFGKKLMPASKWHERKSELREWREAWCDCQNRALGQAGHAVRVDHRSYKDRGIELEPQTKIGTSRTRAAEDGRELVLERMAEHDRIARENGERIRQDPAIALQAITHQRATFTRQDVGRWLNTHTADAEQFQACLDAVMASAELVERGKDGHGRERFTTNEMLEVERRMVTNAEEMAERSGHKVAERCIKQAEASRKLSDEQRAAMRHVVVATGDIAVAEGYAGAGKSYMLGAAREAWESQGFRVHGAALAGKAAEGLELSSGISSRSIHSFEYAWKHGRDQLTSRHVLVIDEAGMVGSRQLDRVLERARQAGAKVVLVGDTEQLQAIEAGAPMRAIAERVGQVSLGEIRRQEVAWQRRASRDFAEGRTTKALDAYELGGNIHEHESQASAMESMVVAWNQSREAHPDQSQIMLAYRRAEVRELNELGRAVRSQAGELGEDQRVTTARGPRDFADGDRVYFLRNDRQLGVMNGSLGTVEQLRGHSMAVRLDDGRRVAFDVHEYNHLDHGYAATVHKAQGVTVDRAHVLAGDLYDRHVAYVGMSRHRQQVDLHWSKEEFGDKAHLLAQLSRERKKDLAIDHERVEKDGRTLRVETLTADLKAREAQHTEALKRWMDYAERYSVRAAVGHQGVGNAGRLWKAEREADRQCLRLHRELKELGCEPWRQQPLTQQQVQTVAEHRKLERERRTALRNHERTGQDAKTFRDAVKAPEAAKDKSQDPEFLAKFKARVAQRQKELDARLRLNERIAKRGKELDRLVGKRLAEEQRQEQERRPSPYDQMSADEIVTRYRQLDAAARQTPITREQAFAQLPKVQQAQERLQAAEHYHAWWQEQARYFESKHPIKAKTGIGTPSYLRGDQGRSVGLYDGLKEAKADLATERERWRALGQSPTLQRKAEAVAVEHNGNFERAKKELELIRPHCARAQMEIDQRLEARAKEIERDRGKGYGLER